MRKWMIVLALVGAGCSSPPLEPRPGSEAAIERLLEQRSTAYAITQYVGQIPRFCFSTGNGTELCEWQVGNSDPGWSSLAEAIGTKDRINLLCEVLESGDARAPGSCTAHPRRSNRYSWKRNQRRTVQLRAAAKAIDSARTLTEMSRLMGSAPEGCVTSPQEFHCLWRADDQTFGHGTLAVWIDVPLSKKIRLRCVFPSDGSFRDLESCAAHIGD